MTSVINRVETAAARWSRQLVDESGRNQLVNFRSGRSNLQLLPTGDGAVDEKAVDRLLSGRSVRLSAAVSADEFDAARRAVQRIHRRSLENREEKGIDTLFVAVGVVSWPAERGRLVRAPLALLPLEASPRDVARRDYNLSLSGDGMLNPVLAQLVETQFDTDTEAVAQAVSEARTREGFEAILAGVADEWGNVPQLSVESMVAVGNFSYASLPMVSDLTRSAAQFARNNAVAAMAGDEAARTRLSGECPGVPHPNETAVADEYLVLDADGSQQDAINRALAGQSLVIIGPPGTGKSQVIANIIAGLAAHGRTALFVAEKRAAIEAVSGRLERVGLSELVMDIHGGMRSRRQFAGLMHDAMRRIQSTPDVSVEQLHERLEASRTDLDRHHRRRHLVRDGEGVSLDQLNGLMFDMGEGVDWGDNMGWDGAERVHSQQLPGLLNLVSEWAELSTEEGAVELSWRNVPLGEQSQAVAAADLVHDLHVRLLPEAHRAIGEILQAARCPLVIPQRVRDWKEALRFLEDVRDVRRRYGGELHRQDHAELLERMGRNTFVLLRPFRSGWREALGEVRGMVRDGTALNARTAMTDLRRAASHVQGWPGLAGWGQGDMSVLESALPDAQRHLDALLDALSRLSSIVGWSDLSGWDAATLAAALAGLERNRHLAAAAPRLKELDDIFRKYGLDRVVARLPRNCSPAQARLTAERAWMAGVWRAEIWSQSETSLFRGPGQDRRQREFCQLDREHLSANSRRIRRLVAERAVSTMDEWPEQTAMLERESVKKTRHRPMRALMSDAAPVLTALWPCWAMSPLMASEVLPARPDLFDVVIMDEASQVLPASAVGALARGNQSVIAGDPRQLPPTAFFTAVAAEDDDEEEAKDLAASMESVLDVMRGGVLTEVMLGWHYRSADSRLIEFSNDALYGGGLTVFPGTAAASPVTLDFVDNVRGSGSTRSHPEEVARVVDLLMEHARRRPEHSLGVITFGIHHAERIDHALRERLSEERDARVAAFFSDDGDEPCFVKSIERVQGDERDHIILSVGYHKNEEGRLLHRFGPVNQDGGERRLNVAASRARRSMTVVSSITHHDFDPERSQSAGVDLLRRFLEYAEHGGHQDGARTSANASGIGADIVRRLAGRGVQARADYGRGQGRVDVAVAHPDVPDRMILAVDTDGPAYGGVATVRERERLRPQVLSDKGWRVHRIWSEQWLRDPDAEIERMLEAWREAATSPPATSEASVETGGTPVSAPVMEEKDTSEVRQGIPPRVRGPIDRYEPSELREMARWIASDGQLRTEAQLTDELRVQLGFRRRGRRIDEALAAAVRELKAEQ